MNQKISTIAERKIIEDFAKEISQKRETGIHPEKTVIDFRNDRLKGKDGERYVYLVPTKLLRFRKDNGRIASDVYSYEKQNGNLDETLDTTQEIIRKFLTNKDEENNIKLRNLIKHSGQIEPAIITCDGFLINGNRRKMVIEDLYERTKEKKYETMKVVILPGADDEGGPPTIKEIEQIENRYQLQSDGKSEYTNFDRAISIQRKIDSGMSLEEQLKDDPSLIELTPKEFKKKLQEVRNKFLAPLECVDRYLENLGRDGLYDSISEGRADKEGRWYSFIDYYERIYKQLLDSKKRNELGIEEDEVGDIEDIAFKIIRKKDFPDHKTHEVIRKLPKILANKDSKKELLKIKSVSNNLSENEYGENDKLQTIDKKWGNKNATAIIGSVKKAINIIEHEKEIETPLTLLDGALKKLNHENMEPEALDIFKIEDALKKSKEIQARAHELEKIFWEQKNKVKKILRKNEN